MRTALFFVVICLLVFTGCRKTEDINTDKDVKLVFSTDTVLFDTVFTAVGSVNKRIKIYNYERKTINISDIRLGGGNSSFFNLIINGSPTAEHKNLSVPGQDSISIYIKATINPNNLNQPFIVEDSILFNTNGNKQAVKLVAYGQNAVFITSQTIEQNTSWTAALPYIINKSVTIAEGATLNIPAGTRVLFHGNSMMQVKGTLNVQGNALNPVLFASDRREGYYENEAGQWNGIHLNSSSTNSKIHYAIIKNAVIGIAADSSSTNGTPKLLLTNSTIKNMSVAGFVGYHTTLNAFNNLFYNCGQHLVYGVGGGDYDLKQNTFAGYNHSFVRKTPALYFSDLEGTRSAELNITLKNNLIWGILTEEFQVDKKTMHLGNINITSNFIKTALQTYAIGNTLHTDPKFVDINGYNFRLQDSSPALAIGEDLSGDIHYYQFLKRDLQNKERHFPSDLGCYTHP